jgi:thymidylate synthase
MQPLTYPSATHAWYHALQYIVEQGDPAKPRGLETKEILHNSVGFDMHYPIVNSPARLLNYKFMAAEAYWILSGDNSCAGIVPYCKNISKFSDNGHVFAGAYGPRYVSQLDYVVETLANDHDSRQAVIEIWRERPDPSKDIPCTLSLTFMIRDDTLHTSVTMRSSDVWLGLPYDFFNFTMMSILVGIKLQPKYFSDLKLGYLYWTGVSSHLYKTNYEGAKQVLDKVATEYTDAGFKITDDILQQNESHLFDTLDAWRNNNAPHGHE